jgi:hypothetical protein
MKSMFPQQVKEYRAKASAFIWVEYIDKMRIFFFGRRRLRPFVEKDYTPHGFQPDDYCFGRSIRLAGGRDSILRRS